MHVLTQPVWAHQTHILDGIEQPIAGYDVTRLTSNCCSSSNEKSTPAKGNHRVEELQFDVSAPLYAACTCRATPGAHRWSNRVQRHSHQQHHHTDNATCEPQEMFPTLMQLTRATTTFAAHGSCRAAGARRTNSDDSWTTGAKLRPLKSEGPPRKLRQMPFT